LLVESIHQTRNRREITNLAKRRSDSAPRGGTDGPLLPQPLETIRVRRRCKNSNNAPAVGYLLGYT